MNQTQKAIAEIIMGEFANPVMLEVGIQKSRLIDIPSLKMNIIRGLADLFEREDIKNSETTYMNKRYFNRSQFLKKAGAE